MDKIDIIFKKIKPIINNCQKRYTIPSWESEDYLQEGMIIALEMYNYYTQHPPKKTFNFYVYFKVRYSCFLIDNCRKAQAYKRRFNQLNYFDVYKMTKILDPTQNVAEDVMYYLLYQEIALLLSPRDWQVFLALRRGEYVDHNKKQQLKKKIIAYIIKFW
jgi:competence protein ComX